MNLEWLRRPYWCPGYIIWFSSAQRCGGCKCKFSVNFVFCGVEEESHPAEKCCLLRLSFERMAWSKGWLAIWELFVVRYPFTTVVHYLARYIMCYVRAPVTAPLWLTAIDVIRWAKVFEAGHIGVSQQFHRLCPHSLTLWWVGMRRNLRGLERGEEQRAGFASENPKHEKFIWRCDQS